MKLVIWSTAFSPSVGGLQRFSEELASWMARRGHEVVVATRTPGIDSSDTPYRVLREATRTQVHREMRRADAVQIAGLSLSGIGLAMAAGRRPVVTHAGPQAVCPAGLAWSDVGTCDAGPSPGPCHVCPSAGPAGWLDVRTHRGVARLAATNVFVSDFLRGLVGLPGQVVYNPLPGRLFRSDETTPESNLIVAAGRLVREKGFDLLIHAMRDLDARLVVAGDGPEAPRLQALAREVDVAARTRFVGALAFEDLWALYQRATLTCVPTRMGETFGYAVAEPMALGVPVVGTPEGAIPELLAGGRGYVASASNVEALAASIGEALGDAAGRRRRASDACAFARRELHEDVIGMKYEELYAA